MIKISVVVPVYGVESYIDQLLQSIQKQSLQEIEVIFVDDGSPDNCPQILDRFAEMDSRYRVFHQKNSGVSAARNVGLAKAVGKYVYIIDSDDWLADDALEKLWSEAERTDSDLIYGDYYNEMLTDTRLIHPFKNEFTTENMNTIKSIHCAVFSNSNKMKVQCPEFDSIDSLGGAPWRMMIRRSLIQDNKISFDSSVKGLGDDILFTLHVYQYVNKISYIQTPIYHYRIVQVSYSHGYKEKLLDNYQLIFNKMEDFLIKNEKDANFWNAYYYSVILYFQQSMVRYFKNIQNSKSEKERFMEMKMLLQKEPYKTAFEGVKLAPISKTTQKLAIQILRMRLYHMYWYLKKYA